MENTFIRKLKTELDQVNANKAELIARIQREYEVIFEDHSSLRHAMNKVQMSTELTHVEGDDWYHVFVRYDLSKFKDVKEYLTEYLRGHYNIEPDFENNTLHTTIGPAILIQFDWRDGYTAYDQDSNKIIASNKVEDDLVKDIEAYMDKSGYYPAVISVDTYGNPSYVRV
jgi:hypothetical protein